MVKYRYIAAEDRDEESRASYTVENAAGNELKERGRLSTATYYIDERRQMNTLSLSFPKDTDPAPILELLEITKIPFETDVSGPLVKIRAMPVERGKLSEAILALSVGKDLDKGRSIPAAIDEKSVRAIMESEVKESGVPLERLGLGVRIDEYLTHTGAEQFVMQFPKGNYGPRIQFLREEGMTTTIDTQELRTLPLTRVEFGDASPKDIARFMEAARKEKYVFEGKRPEGKDNTIHIYGSLSDVADLMQKSGFFMPDELKASIQEKMDVRKGREHMADRPTSTMMQRNLEQMERTGGKFSLSL